MPCIKGIIDSFVGICSTKVSSTSSTKPIVISLFDPCSSSSIYLLPHYYHPRLAALTYSTKPSHISHQISFLLECYYFFHHTWLVEIILGDIRWRDLLGRVILAQYPDVPLPMYSIFLNVHKSYVTISDSPYL